MKAGFEKYIDYDIYLEASVLGIMLLEPASYGAVRGMLIPECFYGRDHQRVYEAIAKVFEAGSPIDLLTVSRHLYSAGVKQIADSNTAYFLTQMTFSVVTSAHLEAWCMLLRELAVKREMTVITSSGFDKSGDVLDSVTDIEKKLKRILDVRATNDWQHISQVGIKLANDIESPKDQQKVYKTAVPELDAINKGFRPGQMIVLAARPGIGKSAMMVHMAIANAQQGHTVGIMGLEMPNESTMQRMVSSESRVSNNDIDGGLSMLQSEESRKVFEAISNLSTLPVYFSDKAQVNIHDIRAKAEKLKRKHGLDMLFIDYLQLVEPDSKKNTNREQEVANISRGIKLMSMVLQIPVIVLAQLNREADKATPELKHLRESGSLEQDADVVIMLHRDFAEGTQTLSDTVKILGRKWRNGTQVETSMFYEGETTRFYTAADPFTPTFDKPNAGFQNFQQPSTRTPDNFFNQ